MSKVRGELMQMDNGMQNGKWGCFLWLTDKHGDSTRTIVAVGDTSNEAKAEALKFARSQHEAAQKRLIRAQSDSIACREMVEALSRVEVDGGVASPVLDEVARIQKLVDDYDPRSPRR
jgi:DNA-binding LacI/PurR family transcriptional regulator